MWKKHFSRRLMAAKWQGFGLAAQVGRVGPMSTILMDVSILGELFAAWVVAGTILVCLGISVFAHTPRSG